MSADKATLNISVISDYICPFCFIGHRRLQHLRDAYKLRINWCFVEIHPETPAEGQPVSRLNYSPEYWNSLMQNLNRLADEEGIVLAERTMTTNSRQALLLAEASKALGSELFYPLHQRLFEACFVDGLNIGDEEVLRQIAQDCNIPENIVEQAWSDPHTYGPADTVPRALRPCLQYAGAINAQGVPTFVFDKEILTGVVDTHILRQAASRMQGRDCHAIS